MEVEAVCVCARVCVCVFSRAMGWLFQNVPEELSYWEKKPGLALISGRQGPSGSNRPKCKVWEAHTAAMLS